jgi:putative membrane protein
VTPDFHPTLNASLNAASACLLLWGFVMIKRGHRDTHKKIMLVALVTSVAFMVSYLIYHQYEPSNTD